MKIGAENRNKLRTMVVLLIIAIPACFYALKSLGVFGQSSAAAAATAASRNTQKKSGVLQARINNNLDPTLRLDRLQAIQKIHYDGGKRNIFRMEEPPPPPLPKPIVPPVNQQPQVAVAPPPPPINLKFYGFSSKPGEPKRVFLAEGEDIFVAREGDVVNRKYKIVQIMNSSVLVEDLLNNNRQTIPLTAPSAG